MVAQRDREWLLKAARGDIATNAAIRQVQIMRARLKAGELDAELAAALEEGDARYPGDAERFVDIRVGPERVETDPATTEEFERIIERLPDIDPEDLPDIDPRDLPPADRIKRSLRTTAQIVDLPPPEWLIDGYLAKNSLALLYGPSGCGKTFLALDWALHVATGSYWHGNRVDAGPVLYVAAEGVAGIGRRVKAWMEHNGIYDLDKYCPIHWLPEAVNIAEPASVWGLIEVVEELQPSLIVIDTLARSIVGADENSAKDMGEVIKHLDQLRRASGATVLVVHHSGKDASAGARGSSALRAAMDTELEVTAVDTQLTVKVTKQKDAAEAAPMRLTRVEVGDSCALVPSSSVMTDDDLPAAVLATLEALREVYVEGGVPVSVWKSAVDVSEATFYRHRSRLLDVGLVENVGTDKQPRYVPVDQEERASDPTQLSGDSHSLTP